MPTLDVIGPAVIAVALVFIWVRRNKEPNAVRLRRRLGPIVVGVGTTLLLASLVLASVYRLRLASVLIMLFGFLYWLINRIDKT